MEERHMYTCHLLKCKTSTEQVMVEMFLVNNFNKEKTAKQATLSQFL